MAHVKDRLQQEVRDTHSGKSVNLRQDGNRRFPKILPELYSSPKVGVKTSLGQLD